MFGIIIRLPSWGSGKNMVKIMPANVREARDMGLIPGLGRSPGEGNDNLLLYSCLGNPMDRVWQAIIHGVTKESNTA